VVSYSEKSKADSYKPDEKVFNKLHHSLLQDFVPEDVNISNDSEEEEDDKPQEKVKARKKKSKDICAFEFYLSQSNMHDTYHLCQLKN